LIVICSLVDDGSLEFPFHSILRSDLEERKAGNLSATCIVRIYCTATSSVVPIINCDHGISQSIRSQKCRLHFVAAIDINSLHSHTVLYHYIILYLDSSYPHGGYVSLGLFLTCAAALSTTTYAVASCRMLVVTFTSTQGDFEQTFDRRDSNDREGDTAERFKLGAGLFQWLKPFGDVDAEDGDSSWSDGYCVGYQSTMLDALSDTAFETARGFAVFAVLLAVIVTLWSLLFACISWNRIQIRLLNGCLLAGAICTGLTFIIKRAAICQTAFQDRSCSIDQGGLMLVAAVIMWMAAFMISIIFLKPDETNPRDDELPIYPPVRISRNQQQSGSKQSGQTPPLSPDYSYDSKESWTSPIPRRSTRASEQLTVDDVTNQQHVEVYMAKRLERMDDGRGDDDDRSIRAEI
jgi:hypothetical protein